MAPPANGARGAKSHPEVIAVWPDVPSVNGCFSCLATRCHLDKKVSPTCLYFLGFGNFYSRSNRIWEARNIHPQLVQIQFQPDPRRNRLRFVLILVSLASVGKHPRENCIHDHRTNIFKARRVTAIWRPLKRNDDIACSIEALQKNTWRPVVSSLRSRDAIHTSSSSTSKVTRMTLFLSLNSRVISCVLAETE